MADFKLGRIKFKWRGDWAVSTAYLVDDIVKYGGNTYVVLSNHTSQSSIANFYTDLSAAKYGLHTEGLYFKGNWAGSTFFKLNDLVKYGAFQYRCKLQHTSGSTFAIGSNWEVFSEGLQFEDSYSASTTYQDGDVVTYGGYSYVYVNNTPQSGVTPIDGSDWNLLNPGFNATGDYNASTAYKTGDTMQFGGWAYVCIVDTTAGQNPSSHASKWKLINQGFKYQSTYNAATAYYKGDVVAYSGSSYVSVAHNHTNGTPGISANWEILAQGDETNVLQERGDIVVRGSGGSARLDLGLPGTVLTSNGTDVLWSTSDGGNVLWVSNTGLDSNIGSQFQPYKTIKYALLQAKTNQITSIDTIAGGTGGTPGTYNGVTGSSGGSGTNATFTVITDGSSTPTVLIEDGSSGHQVSNVITITGSQIGSASNVTFNVASIASDTLRVANGTYAENLPLRVPSGVSVIGEALRNTKVQPASGTGTQIKTISVTGNVSGAVNGTYNYIHNSATSGAGTEAVFNITVSGGTISSTTVYHGGSHFAVNDTLTIPSASIGSGGNATFTVTALENNNASNMWLLNNNNNIRNFSFSGLSATPGAGGTGVPAVMSLDPSGAITTSSPYIQNCTSLNAGATGIQIDGLLHSSGNKSILGNDFTQINSDGKGVHAIGGGRGEMVSIFTYYNAISFHAQSGGFIRGLNCSSAYGEQGAVADGDLASETPITVRAKGQILKYQPNTISTGSTSDIAGAISTNGSGTATILGATSGATATLFRYQVSTDTIHIDDVVGNFTRGEVITITKEDSSSFNVTLNTVFGDSTSANKGQSGFLVALESTDSTLASTGVLKPGANIQFAGDSNYYRISLVTEENTTNKYATIRITSAVTTGNAIADQTAATVTTKFSNVRLTGHDFLDIGTGDFTTTNYPGGPTQPADQADEVAETNGGRVYFTSSDQNGDFRVGDLFRIQQATGIATLNADAFDLSGLSELQLGSIGAEIGATINEFSTDQTLGGNSITAALTEYAVLGYLTRDQAGTGAWVPPTGTTAERPTGGNLYTGALRYNATLVTWEGYNGSQWTGLGGGNPWATITFDGSTAVSIAANDRVFVDSSSFAGTITLPSAPLVGDQVRFLDLAGTFGTNNLTIGRNSLKIMGLTEDMVVSKNNASFGFVYTGSTYGWKLQEVS